jgi:PAS domain S-box-containing protein
MAERTTEAESAAKPEGTGPLEERVLVLAPFGHDGTTLCRALAEAGIVTESCADTEQLCNEIDRGAAVLLALEETLSAEFIDRLNATLRKQPHWSELPIVLLISPHRTPHDALLFTDRVERTSHVAFLDRPVRTLTLVSTVRAALESRRHQYRVRQDIAALQRSEAALRDTAHRLSLAQRAGGVGVFDWDIHTQHVVWTSEMAEIHGITLDAFDGTYESWLEYVHSGHREWVEQLFAEWMRGNQQEANWEHRIIRADGEERWLSAQAQLIRDDYGKPIRIIGTNIDITARKRTEEALRALNETLEQRISERSAELERRARDLQRLASELSIAEHRERSRLSNVLHDELQQMIVAARLRVQSLRRSDGNVSRESVSAVDDLLLDCLNITRDLSRDLSPPVLRHGTLTEAIEWLASWSEEKHNLTVEVEFDDDLPSAPEYMRAFLFQAVRELIFNAKKHARVSEVWVSLRIQDEYLAIQVEDDGEEVDPEILDQQLHDPQTLGLFNIRERLEAQDGKFEASAKPNGGARFKMLVPMTAVYSSEAEEVALVSPHKTSAHSMPGLAGDSSAIRLLVADDHQVVRQGLIGLLDRQNDLTVIGEAANGAEAIEQAHRLCPDAILMDAEMPSMHGVEATRRIKEQHPEIPIIGISAHKEDFVRRSMAEAGADAFVSKEEPAQELVETIRRTARRREDAD